MRYRPTSPLAAALVLTFAACFPAHALAPSPDPLSGLVVDAGSGHPLADVELLLNDGSSIASTDPAGAFTFRNLPPGGYRLITRRLGYHELIRSIEIHDGDAVRLLLSLQPEPLTLDTVEVHAPAPPAGYRIDAAAIRELDDRDVAEVLEHLPGVQVYRPGGPGSRATISLRGSRPDHVRVEVDGVALNNGGGDAVDLSSIPLDAVSSIDIDPATQPGGPGGAVRIHTTTVQPGALPLWNASVEAQSEHSLIGSFSLRRIANPDQSVSFNGSYLASDGDFLYRDESGNSTRRINNQRERVSFASAALTPLGHVLQLESSGGVDFLHAGSPSPLFQPPTPEARQSETGWHGQVSLRDSSPQPSQRITLSAAARQRRYISPREQLDPAGGEIVIQLPSDIEDRDLRGGLRYQHSATLLRDHSFTLRGELAVEAGAERFQSLDHLNIGAASRTAGDVYRSTLAAETRWTAAHRVDSFVMRAQVDGRLDRLCDGRDELSLPWKPSGDTQFSGRTRLNLSPGFGPWSLEFGAGSAVAPPSFVHRFLIESVFTLSNPRLQPERVRELQAGATWVQPIRGRYSLTSSLHGYLRETDHLIVWRRNWRGQYFPDNLDRARARGLELAFELNNESRLRELTAALTWQRVVNATPDSPWLGNSIPFQPDFFGNVAVRVSPLSHLDLLADLRFSSLRYSSESNLDPLSTAGNGLKPHALLDLAVRWRQPLFDGDIQLGVTGAVENAGNTEYELLERMPMPGRTWSLRLEVQNPQRR